MAFRKHCISTRACSFPDTRLESLSDIPFAFIPTRPTSRIVASHEADENHLFRD